MCESVDTVDVDRWTSSDVKGRRLMGTNGGRVAECSGESGDKKQKHTQKNGNYVIVSGGEF